MESHDSNEEICDERFNSVSCIRWGKKQPQEEKSPIIIKDNCVSYEFDNDMILIRGEKIKMYTVDKIDITLSNIGEFDNMCDLIENISITHDSKKWIDISPNILQVCDEMGITHYSMTKENDTVRISIDMKNLYKFFFPSMNTIKINVIKNKLYPNMNVSFDVNKIPKPLECLFENYKEGDKCMYSTCRDLLEIPLMEFDNDVTDMIIKHPVRERSLCEYAILFIKCAKCKSICTCEQKIKSVTMSSSHPIAEWDGSDLCTTYPFIFRKMFPKCSTMGNNIYILPIGGDVDVDNDSKTSAVHLGRIEGSFEFKMNYAYKGDKLSMIIEEANMLGTGFFLGGIMSGKAYCM